MDNTATSQQQLEEFVDTMLTEKNLPGLSNDVRPGVIAEMVQVINDLVNRAVLNALPDDKSEELSRLIDNPDTNLGQVQQLIQDSGIDITQITIDTMTRFRELYLAGPQGEAQ